MSSRAYLIGSGWSATLGLPVGAQLWGAVKQELEKAGDTPLGRAWRDIRDWRHSGGAGSPLALLDTEQDIEVLISRLVGASGALEPDIARRFARDATFVEEHLDVRRADSLLWVVHVINLAMNMYFLKVTPQADDQAATVIRHWIDSLNDGETIVTTNYDTLLEAYLWSRENWSPRDGYGIHFDIEQLSFPAMKWGSLREGSRNLLLKVHGSAGWYRNTDTGAPFVGMDLMSGIGIMGARDRAGLPNEFKYESVTLLQPGDFKELQPHSELKRIRDRAAVAIAKAHTLYVIGYSFPKQDRLMRDLVRGALTKDHRAVVVDPSDRPAAELRSLSSCSVSLRRGTLADWADSEFSDE